MHPILFDLGGFTIYAYGALLAVSVMLVPLSIVMLAVLRRRPDPTGDVRAQRAAA